MKLMSEADFAELAEWRKAFNESSLHSMAMTLVNEATRRGQVVTIEQRPLTPLAMGHHETIVRIREQRILATRGPKP